jgi:hypothetical protein
MRTGTKVMLIALIWIGALITFLTVGLPLLTIKWPHLLPYRENISVIVISLTSGGAGMFIMNEIRKAFENTKSG